MEISFNHQQTAHCESGVTANLLSHYGLSMNEPLAFGIGSGLYFIYLPFVRVDNIPLTSFRSIPGSIFKRATRLLGVSVKKERFKDPDKAMQALDALLEQGIPVGLQVGIFWLPFFPRAMRFHFNAHNLIAYGKIDDTYLLSDPCFKDPVLCSAKFLRKARFAKGALAPQGAMYHVTHVPDQVNLERAMIKGIKKTRFDMLSISPPFCGVTGLQYLSKRVRSWPKKLGSENALLHLAQLIRMMEEIGTGGAGFRYIFAAFLQEAAQSLPHAEHLQRCSIDMINHGDTLREFSAMGAKACKNRTPSASAFNDLADLLLDASAREKSILSACIPPKLH